MLIESSLSSESVVEGATAEVLGLVDGGLVFDDVLGGVTTAWRVVCAGGERAAWRIFWKVLISAWVTPGDPAIVSMNPCWSEGDHDLNCVSSVASSVAVKSPSTGVLCVHRCEFGLSSAPLSGDLHKDGRFCRCDDLLGLRLGQIPRLTEAIDEQLEIVLASSALDFVQERSEILGRKFARRGAARRRTSSRSVAR